MLQETMLQMVNAAIPPELKILNAVNRSRILAAIKAQDYYDGNFWRYIQAETDAWASDVKAHESTDYGRTKQREAGLDYPPSQLCLRYPKFFIDEVASWMFEKPLTIQGDEKPRDRILKVHKQNRLNEKLLQSAGESSLTGGIAVKVLWNEQLQQTRILFVPSRESFPIFNADDTDIMEKVHFCTILDDEKTVWRQTFELRDGVCWVLEQLFDIDELKNGKPRAKETLKDNALMDATGKKFIDFIPVKVIPNEPNLGNVWGSSDLEPLYQPINEVCRKYSDFGDMLGFEMFPITVFANVDWDSTDPPRVAPGAYIKVQGERDNPASVNKMESSMSAQPSVEWYVNQMLGMLHQWSGVPNISRDKIDSMGNMSGNAIRLQYLGIISKTSRKLMYWIPRLEEIYDMALKTEAVYSDYEYVEDYQLEITHTSKLPQNEMEEAQVAAIKVGGLLRAIISQMKRDGVAEPELELAQIIKEQKLIADAENPDVFGKAIADEAGE